MSFQSLNAYTGKMTIAGLVGGGGSGEVTLAGDNVFTGNNEFTQTINLDGNIIMGGDFFSDDGNITLTNGNIGANDGIFGFVSVDGGGATLSGTALNIGGSSFNSTDLNVPNIIVDSVTFPDGVQTQPYLGGGSFATQYIIAGQNVPAGQALFPQTGTTPYQMLRNNEAIFVETAGANPAVTYYAALPADPIIGSIYRIVFDITGTANNIALRPTETSTGIQTNLYYLSGSALSGVTTLDSSEFVSFTKTSTIFSYNLTYEPLSPSIVGGVVTGVGIYAWLISPVTIATGTLA
jgi:hypothetical protein